MKSILTVQEAAEYLRVSRSTVWRWCKDGTFVSAFKIGRNWRVHRAEVEGIIEQYLAPNDEPKRENNDPGSGLVL